MSEAEPAALPVSVIVPARNAATWLPGCLAAVTAQHPGELIVVDGSSTDDTVDLARRAGATVLDDGGAGVAAARMIGARAATFPVLALIDTDVVIPTGGLAALLAEFRTGGYDGLQFDLHSYADPAGYWGDALAWHHNHSRMRHWFGVSASLIRRDLLLAHGLDETFRTGEDIELRIRLQSAGARLGVSTTVHAGHRYAPGLATARDQWSQDGAGLARTASKHPARAVPVTVMPLLATIRGAGLAAVTAPRYLPYWVGFLLGNYRAMLACWLPGRRS